MNISVRSTWPLPMHSVLTFHVGGGTKAALITNISNKHVHRTPGIPCASKPRFYLLSLSLT